MYHRVIQYLLIVHSMNQKTNLIIIEAKIVLKKLSKDLREHASKIINYEKKKMISLTTEEKIYHN